MHNKEYLLDNIKKQARWNQKDAYPACKEWRDEDNKLLEFAEKQGQLKHYEQRLKTNNKSQRDETISELRAAYFFNKGCGTSITEWHPNSGRGDFIISINKDEIFCEVKSPGWEGEVVSEQGKNSPRLNQEKYISGEVKSVDNSSHIRDIIRKAYNKFSDNKPNLLIIIDDFWVDCFTDKLCVDRALYRPKLPPPYVDNEPEGLFVGNNYEKLGGVFFTKLNLVSNRGFVWKVHIALNKNAMPSVIIPQKLVDTIESIQAVDNNTVEVYRIDNGWLKKI